MPPEMPPTLKTKGEKGYISTCLAFLWMHLASEPLMALYALFPFILRKDLGASAIQVSIFISLRPVLSVFSFYWNAYQMRKGRSLSGHLMSAWLLAYVPFLIFPFLSRYWYFLLAASFYQLFSKAGAPPFMELFKQTIPRKPRESLYSLIHMICFAASGIFGFFMGKFLDGSNWEMVACLCALIALTSVLIQRKMPKIEMEKPSELSTSNLIVEPLKQSLKLMKTHPEFKNFQLGFMIGGSALMFMAPALALFYADNLKLSHESICTARFGFMTLGVVVSSFLWKQGMEKFSLNRLMPWITIGFGLFPVVLLFTYFHPHFLNFAFLLYGIAQAGSHLVWNLSGTIFSQDKDSMPFTALNILTQGVRGMIVPLLGGILSSFLGAFPVLILGSLICFYGVFVMFKNNNKMTGSSSYDAT